MRLLSSLSAWAAPIALVVLVAMIGAMLPVAPVAADGGVPLPLPAGTTWRVVAGYNTGSHNLADGGDPHALDFVRVDDATDWTPVLAPVDGTVTWVGSNCLTIRDANELAHLLCHLEPAGHLRRGVTVLTGDEVGRIFPVGYDANGGIAHLHYAIHRSPGNGRLGESLPFMGEYALEGVQLPWREEFNLYQGLEFTSTNRPNWSLDSAQFVLRPGANQVVWHRQERAVAEALANVVDLSHAYRWDRVSGSWLLWSPHAPGFLNSLTHLSPQDSLTIVVGSQSTWSQTP